MKRAAKFWALAAVVLAASLVGGCEKEQFGEAERKEVRKVLQTGVDLDSDPYVQAETLRVFEIIKKPELNHFAEELVEDKDSAMVRVAALRVLMATGAGDVRRLTLARFNKAGVAEQKAIMNAALEYGSPRLKRVVTARALRSSDDDLRRIAFEQGPLARLKKAHAEQKTELLKNTLIPEIGTSVGGDDEELSALALEALVAIGEEERAQPLIAKLQDKSAEREDRLQAARALGRAKVAAAVPAFEEILESVKVSKKGEFVLPKKIDAELVRAATLGLVATGETKYVKQAQKYLINADEAESIEVLRALASNPHEDAAISLKIAMQDARQPVRYRAIELFRDHEKATAKAFLSALRAPDFESQKLLSQILADRFPKEWVESIKEDLANKDRRQATLELLRDVIVTSEDAQSLAPLSDELYKLATSGEEKTAALASLLFVKLADEGESRRLLEKVEDPATRYAYLEHLVRTAPKQHVEYFRRHFYSDLYAIRLMSAAGMLLAYDEGVVPKGEKEGEKVAENTN